MYSEEDLLRLDSTVFHQSYELQKMELQTIKVLVVGRVVRDGGLAELMSAVGVLGGTGETFQRLLTGFIHHCPSFYCQQQFPRVKSESCSNLKPHLIYWGIGATSRECVKLHPM